MSDSVLVRVQPLREETRETLENNLLPLNRSEYFCELCGFENKVDEGKKIVVECQGCHETILGGLPNSVDHWKYFRCGCNLLVSAKTFPDDEMMEKRYFLGNCPKCHKVLLIDSPDIEDTRYYICPSCQKCLSYEKRKNPYGKWPMSTSCVGCHANISLPQRENDSKLEIRLAQILSVCCFSVSIVSLICSFVLGLIMMIFYAVAPYFLVGFFILLVIYYPKWRWGTAQEIRFDSENLPETLDFLTERRRTRRNLNLTLNIKKSHHCDSLLTEDDIDVLKK